MQSSSHCLTVPLMLRPMTDELSSTAFDSGGPDSTWTSIPAARASAGGSSSAQAVATALAEVGELPAELRGLCGGLTSLQARLSFVCDELFRRRAEDSACWSGGERRRGGCHNLLAALPL